MREHALRSHQLKNHKKEHESLLPKFKCEEFDQIFLKEKQPKEHISQKHKTYPCKECEKVFDYEVNLENHIKAVMRTFSVTISTITKSVHMRKNVYIFIKIQKIVCRFGSECERQMCIFKHEETDDDENKDQEEISGD